MRPSTRLDDLYEHPGISGGFAVSLVWWSRVVGFSCHGGCLLELSRGQHAEAAVAGLPVVEALQVRNDRVGQRHPGPPAVPVQQLDLQARPERLDHGVVVAVPTDPWRAPGPSPGPLGERAQEATCTPGLSG